MAQPKYPNISVKLIGKDANAHNLLARVNKALRKNGVPPDERDDFRREATSGDYENLLSTITKWVHVR